MASCDSEVLFCRSNGVVQMTPPPLGGLTARVRGGDRDGGEHHERIGLGARADHGPGVGFGHDSTIEATRIRIENYSGCVAAVDYQAWFDRRVFAPPLMTRHPVAVLAVVLGGQTARIEALSAANAALTAI